MEITAEMFESATGSKPIQCEGEAMSEQPSTEKNSRQRILLCALTAYASQARYAANAIAQDRCGALGYKDPNKAIAAALDDAELAEEMLGEARLSPEPAAEPDIPRALRYLEGARQFAQANCPNILGDLDEIELSLRTTLTKDPKHG